MICLKPSGRSQDVEVDAPPMDDDRPLEPTVERVDRPDGRYVLYFSWPQEPPVSEPAAEPVSAADE